MRKNKKIIAGTIITALLIAILLMSVWIGGRVRRDISVDEAVSVEKSKDAPDSIVVSQTGEDKEASEDKAGPEGNAGSGEKADTADIADIGENVAIGNTEDKKSTEDEPEPENTEKVEDPTAPAAPKSQETPAAEESPTSTAAAQENATSPAAQEDADFLHGQIRDGKIYIMGFGWVDYNGGGTVGVHVDDMYENGNKVGVMD